MAAAAPSSGTLREIPLNAIPLYQAMNVSKHKEIDRMLVEGVDLSLIDDHGENYFHHLVKPGSLPYSYRVDYMNRALPFIDPSFLPMMLHYTNYAGLTPLHLLILNAKNKNKHLSDLIDGFVRLGAAVNQPTAGREALTPLMLAVKSPIGAWLMERLLAHGADITQTDAEGRTVFHHAMIESKPAVLDVLIEHSKPHWTTPLITGNNSSWLIYLKDRYGKTALNYSDKMTDQAIKKAMQRWNIAPLANAARSSRAALAADEEKEPGSLSGDNTAAVLKRMLGQGRRTLRKPLQKRSHLRSARRHLKRKLRRTVRVPR